MAAFHGTMSVNEEGHLVIGGCDTVELTKKFGTPLYVLDEQEIRKRCRAYKEAFKKRYPNADVLYASKAFISLAMCQLVDQEGLGLDVVSGGEVYIALQAGFPADKIYVHGNNKSKDELSIAIDAGVKKIVVDNFYELDLLAELLQHKEEQVEILLRITPEVEASTHDYIQTGQQDSKFGFSLTDGGALTAVKKAMQNQRINLKGIHCHIGSQIFEPGSYQATAEVALMFFKQVKEELGLVLDVLNLGGGLGIQYTADQQPPDIDAFVEAITNTVISKANEYKLPLPKIILEPGRSIVGEAGTTLYTLGSCKEIPQIRTYVAVDGGMPNNPRPALYDAEYEAMIANKVNQEPTSQVTIAGKCCESGDILIWDLPVPDVESGDILAVFCTGAYTYSMSSNYNGLPRPAMVLVNSGNAKLIIQRETYKDVIKNDLRLEEYQVFTEHWS
ncbi:diaminopimelate decarboxylase [Metallumcola ferriviriculae]|uniref:Diaminopimelate decarboxylase n=1 Tax=Metallumcola ferriviriculae TaxID=3039180 RepID=A0AAU0UJL1_9FIRM|nr:diaminopimelate decarboxylase [Desulfitibacteraceae bacterium MK1]